MSGVIVLGKNCNVRMPMILIKKHLGLLAKLIAEEKADVKIAFLKEGKGIFHRQSSGLLEDSEGNKVSFFGIRE